MAASKWISCYIFSNAPFNKVLVQLVKPMIDDLKKKGLIKNYFFIRYWENGPHIRLRVKLSSSNERKFVHSYLENTISSFFAKKENYDYRIDFNEYRQETDRYGGTHGLDILEESFRFSSDVILQEISNKYPKWEYGDSFTLAIKLHLLFAKVYFKEDLESAIRFFDFTFRSWISHALKTDGSNAEILAEAKEVKNSFKTSYLEQQTQIDQLCKILWEQNIEDKSLLKWQNSAKSTMEKLIDCYEKSLLKQPSWANFGSFKINAMESVFWPINDSLNHMSNNRLGIRLNDESFIAFLILNGLQSLQSKKIHSEKVDAR